MRGTSLQIRRVVTGHDQNGRAVVTIDETATNVTSRRANHQSCVIWSTGEFPADNSGGSDGGQREVATTDPHGTVFRLVEFGPGVAPRNHRTESIDYAVVISGEIDNRPRARHARHHRRSPLARTKSRRERGLRQIPAQAHAL